jgi:hypothetical protein
MKILVGHLRANTIAYVALVVAMLALAGASYAAIIIPAGSVGARQLRNAAVTSKKLASGSVTSTKLDGRSIAGYVAFWAKVDTTGRVVASSAPAQALGWGNLGGNIDFHGELPRSCFPFADAGVPDPGGYIYSAISSSASGRTEIGLKWGDNTFNGQPQPPWVDVAEICP